MRAPTDYPSRVRVADRNSPLPTIRSGCAAWRGCRIGSGEAQVQSTVSAGIINPSKTEWLSRFGGQLEWIGRELRSNWASQTKPKPEQTNCSRFFKQRKLSQTVPSFSFLTTPANLSKRSSMTECGRASPTFSKSSRQDHSSLEPPELLADASCGFFLMQPRGQYPTRFLQQVKAFAQHFGCSPEVLGPEEVRAWQVQLIEVQRHSRSAASGHCGLTVPVRQRVSPLMLIAA